MMKKISSPHALIVSGILAVFLLMITGAGHMVLSDSGEPLHCKRGWSDRAQYLKNPIERYFKDISMLLDINLVLEKKAKRYQNGVLPMRLSDQFSAMQEYYYHAEQLLWRELSTYLVHENEPCTFESKLIEIAALNGYDLNLLAFEEYSGLRFNIDHNLEKDIKKSNARPLDILLKDYLQALSEFDIIG